MILFVFPNLPFNTLQGVVNRFNMPVELPGSFLVGFPVKIIYKNFPFQIAENRIHPVFDCSKFFPAYEHLFRINDPRPASDYIQQGSV